MRVPERFLLPIVRSGVAGCTDDVKRHVRLYAKWLEEQGFPAAAAEVRFAAGLPLKERPS